MWIVQTKDKEKKVLFKYLIRAFYRKFLKNKIIRLNRLEGDVAI